MTPANTEIRPKYACTECGSTEVRGDFDTYQVYQAEGNKLVHLRSEWTDPAILELYCNVCHVEIEVDLDGVVIE